MQQLNEFFLNRLLRILKDYGLALSNQGSVFFALIVAA